MQSVHRPVRRTFDPSAERVLVATITEDQRTIVTPLTADEREFFDNAENRSIRALMTGNRAPFLS